ncbi:hypothetical protein NBRC110019_12550 [Neptunitalea chrysea]|uniref:DUF922 domain-containing protein n=1 Tax=Neptunitalea chrysea TaxID=1647581 RepID=A0A9W6B3W6_9FLAO|nr:DUF922 domain-containing protein [Neptunitalea chrysea]GLB52216.1 hypothetical protein NBRC110019_12550 [Neptunitalea chrysea]
MRFILKYFWIAFSFFCLAFTVHSEDKPILWNKEHRLSWDDFRAAPDDGSRAVAITASGISYQLSAELKENAVVEVDCEVGAYFYPYESWCKLHLTDKSTLGHEQLHFDISELMAREFRKRIANKKFTKNVKQEVKEIYFEVSDSLDLLQKLYDKETNFSMNDEKQAYWHHKIALELEATKNYQ